jgi:hypothetical protein
MWDKGTATSITSVGLFFYPYLYIITVIYNIGNNNCQEECTSFSCVVVAVGLVILLRSKVEYVHAMY